MIGLIAVAAALLGSGRVAEAVRLVGDAAARSDPDALFTLATWRLAGSPVPRDLALARSLFARAAGSGHPDAAAVHIAFVGNGTGGPADWPGAVTLLHAFAQTDAAAREQHGLITAMDLTPDGAPKVLPSPELISESPDAMRIPTFFTVAECDYLISIAEPMLEPAVVLDPRTNRPIRDSVRTGNVAAFPLAIENPAVRALNRRIAAASGTNVAQGEPLQVIAYRPGQQYRAHVDAIAGADNQRILTMLVYLNDGYEGGETRFLPDGPTMRARKGDALLFRNVLPSGRPDPAARHAGLIVRSGRKLIASRWIRQRPLDLGDRPRS